MAEMIVLRIVHVLGGLFWVGGMLFSSVFLMPAMAEAGPAAGAIMGSLRRRRLFVVMPIVALVTILAGLRLMWITSAEFSAAYFESGRGATFAWSGSAAIVAFFIGILVHRPTALRMGSLQQRVGTASDDRERAELTSQLTRLQRRSVRLGQLINVLLIVAAGGMAAARYIP